LRPQICSKDNGVSYNVFGLSRLLPDLNALTLNHSVPLSFHVPRAWPAEAIATLHNWHYLRGQRDRKPGVKINLTDVNVLQAIRSVDGAEHRRELVDVESSAPAPLEGRQLPRDLFGRSPVFFRA